jgi:hypothetical protein
MRWVKHPYGFACKMAESTVLLTIRDTSFIYVLWILRANNTFGKLQRETHRVTLKR